MLIRLFILSFLLNLNSFGQGTQKVSLIAANQELNAAIGKVQSVHYDAHFKHSLKEIRAFFDKELKKYDDANLKKQDSIPLKDLQRIGMQTMAMMSNGHTRLDWLNMTLFDEFKSFEYLKFSLAKDENGYFSREEVYEEDKIYMRAINGVPIEEVLNELKTFLGGSEAYREEYAMQLFPLLLFYSTKIEAPYTIFFDDDARFIAKTQSFMETIQMIQSESSSSPYTYSIDDKESLIHLEYNSCEDEERFESFVEEMFKTAKEKNVSNLIIDIRNNRGGNSAVNDILISYITKKKYKQSSGRIWKVSEIVQNQIKEDSLWYEFFGTKWINKYLSLDPGTNYQALDNQLIKPKKRKYFFEGEVVLLTGGRTFSSANFLADAFKTFEMGTIIGQPTGENTNDYGEIVYEPSGDFGFQLVIATTYDIGTDGNKDRMEPVQPDILAKGDAFERALKFLKLKE